MCSGAGGAAGAAPSHLWHDGRAGRREAQRDAGGARVVLYCHAAVHYRKAAAQWHPSIPAPAPHRRPAAPSMGNPALHSLEHKLAPGLAPCNVLRLGPPAHWQEDLEARIRQLEANLDARVVTVVNRASVEEVRGCHAGSCRLNGTLGYWLWMDPGRWCKRRACLHAARACGASLGCVPHLVRGVCDGILLPWARHTAHGRRTSSGTPTREGSQPGPVQHRFRTSSLLMLLLRNPGSIQQEWQAAILQ